MTIQSPGEEISMRTGDNIRLRADGRFEARYAKGRDGSGRIIYGCCYGKTYEEACRKREEALWRLRPVREMNLLILGTGSHGEAVREIAAALGIFHEIAFWDDDPDGNRGIGRCADMAHFAARYPVAIPAVMDWTRRMYWIGELAQSGFILPVLIHPAAVVSRSAAIGYGTVVGARAVIEAGAVIGNGCVISSGAVVGHGGIVGNGCHVTYNAAVAPNAAIPEGRTVESDGSAASGRGGGPDLPNRMEGYCFEMGI